MSIIPNSPLDDPSKTIQFTTPSSINSPQKNLISEPGQSRRESVRLEYSEAKSPEPQKKLSEIKSNTFITFAKSIMQ